MSYARIGDDSDVYVYRSVDGTIVCHWCRLDAYDNHDAPDPVTMLVHLAAHICTGHKVPDYAIQRLIDERDSRD